MVACRLCLVRAWRVRLHAGVRGHSSAASARSLVSPQHPSPVSPAPGIWLQTNLGRCILAAAPCNARVLSRGRDTMGLVRSFSQPPASIRPQPTRRPPSRRWAGGIAGFCSEMRSDASRVWPSKLAIPPASWCAKVLPARCGLVATKSPTGGEGQRGGAGKGRRRGLSSEVWLKGPHSAGWGFQETTRADYRFPGGGRRGHRKVDSSRGVATPTAHVSIPCGHTPELVRRSI